MTGIRVCFCDFDDDADRTDPDAHQVGCLMASMLSMQRAREAHPIKWWVPVRNWMRECS